MLPKMRKGTCFYGMKEKNNTYHIKKNGGYKCLNCNRVLTGNEIDEVETGVEGVGSAIICGYCASTNLVANI